MRGRKPRDLTIRPDDRAELEQIARSRYRPAFQVLRAIILLSIAGGERVRNVAEKVNVDPATVWRTCRKYETEGMASVTSGSTPRPKGISGGSPDVVGQPAGVGARSSHEFAAEG